MTLAGTTRALDAGMMKMWPSPLRSETVNDMCGISGRKGG
jgi:hypothetical protein